MSQTGAGTQELILTRVSWIWAREHAPKKRTGIRFLPRISVIQLKQIWKSESRRARIKATRAKFGCAI
jgi:hypothetical protein